MPLLLIDDPSPRRDRRAAAGLEAAPGLSSAGRTVVADPGTEARDMSMRPALVLVADSDVARENQLPPTLPTAEASGAVVSQSLAEAVGVFESNLIQDALRSSRGNRAKAARLLNTTERILRYKVRRYGIDPRWFRG
jgi:transcriptional regulator with GAF, ATPase, and Fis domain